MRPNHLPVVATALGVMALLAWTVVPACTGDDWPMFRHDPAHSGYSTSQAPNTSHVLWTFATGGSVASSPAAAAGRVYVGSHDGRVYCLDAATGAKQWEFTTGGPVYSSPAVADGKVYVGSWDRTVYCLGAATGTKQWQFTTGSYVDSSLAVADGKVYVGSYDYRVYCLSAATGAKQWQFITAGQVQSCCPAAADGKVYVGSYGKVYCLNAATGVKQWEFATYAYGTSSPAVGAGRVYVGSWDNRIHCLDAATGAKQWEFTTGGGVYSSPALADGRIYVGSNDAKVYCLDAATGAKQWEFRTWGPVLSSPAVADGRVYVGSDDGKVYAFADNQPPTCDIISGPSSPTTDHVITFYSGATDDDGAVASVAWDFGDGGTGSGDPVGHQYAMPGSYTVTVTVCDDDGYCTECTLDMAVGKGANIPPVCEVSYEPLAPETGQDITFNGNAYDPNPWGQIVSRQWDFGDGYGATIDPATHAYADGRDYTVCVTVTDDQGGQTTCCTQVTVVRPCDCDVAIDRTHCKMPAAGHIGQCKTGQIGARNRSFTESCDVVLRVTDSAGVTVFESAPTTIGPGRRIRLRFEHCYTADEIGRNLWSWEVWPVACGELTPWDNAHLRKVNVQPGERTALGGWQPLLHLRGR
jgi:outer membrane protein assembly factor BamB/chitodextrinase